MVANAPSSAPLLEPLQPTSLEREISPVTHDSHPSPRDRKHLHPEGADIAIPHADRLDFIIPARVLAGEGDFSGVSMRREGGLGESQGKGENILHWFTLVLW